MISRVNAQKLKNMIDEHVEAAREDTMSGSYPPADCENIRLEFRNSQLALDNFIMSLTKRDK